MQNQQQGGSRPSSSPSDASGASDERQQPAGRVVQGEAAGQGVGGASPGRPGGTLQGHYPNADNGYGTGIHAKPLDDQMGGTPHYGGRPGEYDAGQRHNDNSAAQGTAPRSKPASEEERHGAQHGSDQPGPSGGSGTFGTNPPFGGGPKPDGKSSR